MTPCTEETVIEDDDVHYFDLLYCCRLDIDLLRIVELLWICCRFVVQLVTEFRRHTICCRDLLTDLLWTQQFDKSN